MWAVENSFGVRFCVSLILAKLDFVLILVLQEEI